MRRLVLAQIRTTLNSSEQKISRSDKIFLKYFSCHMWLINVANGSPSCCSNLWPSVSRRNPSVHLYLFRHQAAIEEICRCASRELELEAKMRSTEEEWTEQVNV